MKRLAVLLCFLVILTGLPLPAGANVTPISVLAAAEEIPLRRGTDGRPNRTHRTGRERHIWQRSGRSSDAPHRPG